MSDEKLLNKKSLSSRTSSKETLRDSTKTRKSSKKHKSDDLEHNHEHKNDEDCDDEYAHFVKNNKFMWKGMTLMASLGFCGLAAGTYIINKNEEGDCLGI